MKKYNRTTILLPHGVYKKTKIHAAYEDKSLSRFIADLLEEHVYKEKKQRQPLPLGKYSLKKRPKLDRQTIYGSYLRRKISR